MASLLTECYCRSEDDGTITVAVIIRGCRDLDEANKIGNALALPVCRVLEEIRGTKAIPADEASGALIRRQ
jgi:hypothetical protein